MKNPDSMLPRVPNNEHHQTIRNTKSLQHEFRQLFPPLRLFCGLVHGFLRQVFAETPELLLQQTPDSTLHLRQLLRPHHPQLRTQLGAQLLHLFLRSGPAAPRPTFPALFFCFQFSDLGDEIAHDRAELLVMLLLLPHGAVRVGEEFMKKLLLPCETLLLLVLPDQFEGLGVGRGSIVVDAGGRATGRGRMGGAATGVGDGGAATPVGSGGRNGVEGRGSFLLVVRRGRRPSYGGFASGSNWCDGVGSGRRGGDRRGGSGNDRPDGRCRSTGLDLILALRFRKSEEQLLGLQGDVGNDMIVNRG